MASKILSSYGLKLSINIFLTFKPKQTSQQGSCADSSSVSLRSLRTLLDNSDFDVKEEITVKDEPLDDENQTSKSCAAQEQVS